MNEQLVEDKNTEGNGWSPVFTLGLTLGLVVGIYAFTNLRKTAPLRVEKKLLNICENALSKLDRELSNGHAAMAS